MNAPLRRVGVVAVILFALLFVNLNYVQAYKADDYRTNDHNGRVQYSEYQHQRGFIALAHGVVLAKSVPTNDNLKYLRTYPGDNPAAYAFATGYKPVGNPATGVEKLENDFLNGNADALIGNRILETFTGQKKPGGNVILSLSKAGQETAYKDLLNNGSGAKVGAVVALDPRTGAVLTDVSIPSYDPNPLAGHDTEAAGKAWDQLNNTKLNPLLNRAFSDRFAPGSTFKVIDSAAALTQGLKPETVIPAGTEYKAPGTTHVIRNAPGVYCPGPLTLKDALTRSCNTAYARLCVEQLNSDKIRSMARDFGFETEPTLQLDDKNTFNVVASKTGPMTTDQGQDDKPILAQSCIGQAEVQMSPLQGALVAATVANNGAQMRPYLIDTLQTPDLSTTYKASPRKAREPISEPVARQLQDMMLSVVQRGTGTAAQIPGYEVGGKTGTAQTGEAEDHGWFIGFAMKDGVPQVAVAVFLANAGNGGSHEASGIAGDVMKAIMDERGTR